MLPTRTLLVVALLTGCGAPDTADAGTQPLDGAAPRDAAARDGGGLDGSAGDAGARDADAGVSDAGLTDAGALDAAASDAGHRDASSDAGALSDAGGSDAGRDGGRGTDAGSTPSDAGPSGADAGVCVDGCAMGATRCAGDAVQTCGDFDADPCREWSAPAACPSGQVCGGGVCSATVTTGALTGAVDVRRCQLSPAGAGATYIAWQQGPSGGRDIYLLRLERDGAVSAGWPASGLAVSSAPNSQISPQLVADGAGGVLVVWTDYRGSPSRFTTEQIYATRVRADGTLHPSWPAAGLRVSAGAGFSRGAAVIGDGAGGLYAVWQHDPSSVGTYNRLYAQRVTSAGALAWTTPVAVSATVPVRTNQRQYRVVGDGAGGAIVVWNHLYTTISHDVLAQRFSPSGARLWAAAGAVVADDTAETGPEAVSDGAGGVIVSFEQLVSARSYVHAQRLNASGARLWTPSAGGVRVCCAGGFSPLTARVEASLGGDAIVSWTSTGDVDAARISAASGASSWGPTSVHTETGDTRDWTSASDGAGGHLSIWSERSSLGSQLHLQRLSATGARPAGWASARPIGGATGFVGMPDVRADAAGGVWACWSRTVGGAPWELRAARTGL